MATQHDEVAPPAPPQRPPSSYKQKARKPPKRKQRFPENNQFPECNPNKPVQELWDNGYAFGKKGHMEGAKECFLSVSMNDPEDEKIWVLLGEVGLHMGTPDFTTQMVERVLELNPDNPEGYFQLGNVAMGADRFGEAIRNFEHAIELDPNHVNSMVNLGATYGNLNNFAQAVPYYERAVQIMPNLTAAKHNLGAALHSLKRYGPALQVLTELCRDEPDFFECHLSLGHVQRELKKLEDARDSYYEAMRVKPESVEALLNYFYTKQQLVQWEDRNELFEQLLYETQMQLEENTLPTVSPYFSLLSPFEPREMLAIAEHHARRAQQKVDFIKLPEHWPWWNHQPPQKQLRIGYISADFRMHVTAHLIQSVFQLHDRDQFEVFVFALNANDESLFRQRIHDSVGDDHFFDLYSVPDDAAAELINEHQIHVLIDIDYYKGRIGILAMKPAAIQINWLAHPGTSGATYVQHIFVDPIVAPPEHSMFFSESIMYMKHHYQVNDHKSSYPKEAGFDWKATREEEGLPLDKTVIANFNGLYKAEPEVFSMWMNMMKKSGDQSVLWLVSETPDSNRNVMQRAEERGVDPSRLIMAERADFDKHIIRSAASDLFVDCFTYNAHTTATDVLWGGVPVVTYPGVNMNNRLAAGVLTGFGRTCPTIARTPKDYEDLGVRIATSKKARDYLKRLMFEADGGLESRELFDTLAWVRDFETGLRLTYELLQARSKGRRAKRSGAAGWQMVANPRRLD